MFLLEGVESALHLCVLLTGAPGAVPASQLAAFHALPPAATAKVLQQLAGAGVIEARAGRRGGYALARPASEITLDQVVAAVDGRDPVFRCREIRRRGPCAGPANAYSSRCAIACLFDEAERAWWQVLRHESLADLSERIGLQLDRTIRARSREWLDVNARAV